MFGTEHLVWLAAYALTCVILSLIYQRIDKTGRRRMGIVVAVITMGLQIWRIIFQISGGIFNVNYFPLHLCDVTAFLVLIHSLRGGKVIGEFLYCLGIPGAVSALIFPDWTRYPILNIQSLQSFTIHIFMTAYIVMLVAGGDIRPEAKRLPKCFLMLLGIGIPIYFFNKIYDTNFFFTNWPSPGSPMEFLETFLGNPGYILGVVFLIVVLWVVMYLPFELARAMKRTRRIRG